MQRSTNEHRREFDELGYTIFENVLSPAELAPAVEAIDKLISPDSAAPLVTSQASNRNGRKQLNVANYCGKTLANLEMHPRVIEAVEVIAGGRHYPTRTPTPCVTFKSPPGFEDFGEGYHVDWGRTPPQDGDDLALTGVLHLAKVEPGGGAFMVRPGSHRLVMNSLSEPVLCERAFKQDFKSFPGLGAPREMVAPAGSLLLFHAFLVHDRSENVNEQPRKILFMSYRPWREGEFERRDRAVHLKYFHAEHLPDMDSRIRTLCGLD